MAAYNAYFEITDQSGNLFSHSERFTATGLAKVRVREDKEMRWTDWSGTRKCFYAHSSKPFVIVITKWGHTESRDGSSRDDSEIRVVTTGEVTIESGH